MRPAQKAPENMPHPRSRGSPRNRFNEAGAKSAGKPSLKNDVVPKVRFASMRPAQKAPENHKVPSLSLSMRKALQ